MTRTNLKQASVANPQKWFQRRRRWHDPMLVLNMSIFNFDGGWNRIFNPLPQRENVWGAHAPRVSVPVRLGLFGALAEKLVSFHSKPVVIMTPTHSSTLVTEVPRYAKLQREIHDALRAQRPEWIQADGSSPTCDYYESRFSELLVGHNHPDLGSSSIAVAT